MVDKTLYISGQIGFDPKTMEVKYHILTNQIEAHVPRTLSFVQYAFLT